MSDLEIIKTKADEIFRTNFDIRFDEYLYACFNDVAEENVDDIDKPQLEIENWLSQNYPDWIVDISTCGNSKELYSIDICIYKSEE